MRENFSVPYRKSNGNLHLRPRGDLDGSSAWVLIHLIHQIYDGKGRVFIDTQDLREIHPFGIGILKSELRKKIVPPDCLFFKGKKGFDLAPDGTRVIIARNGTCCRCDGNCNNCRCPLKNARQN